MRLSDVVRYDTVDETEAVRFPELSIVRAEADYRSEIVALARKAKEPFLTASVADARARDGGLHNVQLGLQLSRLVHLPLAGRRGDKAGAFWVYAFLGICALVFFATFVPETKDRSLEQIQADLGADADLALTRGQASEREPEPARA